jgi:hypothetical protein
VKRIALTVLLLAAALLPLIASGCGGGDVTRSPSENQGDLAGSSPATSETAAQPDNNGSPQVASASVDRKITQTASISLQVKAVGDAFQEVGRIAAAAGGFVTSSSFSDQGEQQVAAITIRVPAARFDEVLASLRGLAVKVENEQSQANDVTQEYTDLGSRLRNLQATEAQYLEFMKGTKDTAEVLQVQDRLNSVRGDIETVQGRINLLDNLSDMSTVTVHLRPEATSGGGSGNANPAEAARAAWGASLKTLRAIATAVVAVAAFSWWLVPVLVVLALIGRKLSPRPERGSKQ